MAYLMTGTAPPRTASPRRYAAWTVPAQPMPQRPSAAELAGKAVAIAGFAAIVAVAAFRLLEARPSRNEPQRERALEPEDLQAARQLAGGAAILAFSVLTDSAVEHYRGAYHNPAMYVAPAASAVSLANGVHMALTPHVPGHVSGAGRLALSGLTMATGAAGFLFHLYNIAKREGGMSLLNLFYGAPIAAPAAIAVSGLCGLAAAQLVAEAEEGSKPTLLGQPAGAVVGLGAAGAMIGTVGEAALLHFRGAFHDPFMFVPATLPPAAAAVLAAAIWRPRPPLRRAARLLLRLTALAGIAGAGFHVYGVSRNMGGFYNWSQNILNGPPIPAPPSFTGVALAGLAAVRLMEMEAA
jgi:hypothetical protein